MAYEPRYIDPFAAPAAIPIEDQNRSIGEWLKDTAISAGGAGLGILQAGAGLGQLIPGLHYAADPLQEGLTAAREGLYGYQSPQAQAARQRLGQAIEEGRYWDAAGEAFTPANFADLALNAAASLGGMRAAGALAGRLGGRAGAAYQGLKDWQKAGLLEGVYTAGALGGGLSDTEEGYGWGRLAAIPAGALTGAIGGASARYLPDPEMWSAVGGAGARQAVARQAASGPLWQRMLSSDVGRTALGFAKEGGEEFLQSGQESLWQNLGQGEPLNLNQALAEAMVGAVPGGAMGGVFGYLQRPADWRADVDSLTQPPSAAAGLGYRPPPGTMGGAEAYAAMGGPYAQQPAPVLAPSGYPIATDPYAALRQAQINALTGDVSRVMPIRDTSFTDFEGVRGAYTPYTAASRRAAMLERGRLAEQAAQRILNPQEGEVPSEPLNLIGLAIPAGSYQAQQSAAEAAAMRGLQADRQIAALYGPWQTGEERALARQQEAWRQRQIDAAIAARQRPQPAPAPLTTGFAQPKFAPGPTTIEGQIEAEKRAQAAQEAAAAGQRATARGLAGEPIGEQQAMAFIIPENVPIPATTPQVQLLDADRLPLATVIEGVGIQPDLFATQALKDKVGYDHERAVTALVRQATIDRLSKGVEDPEAAKRAIATLEELNLDDKVNQQRLLSYIQQYPNATASQIERFRTPGSKMYARKDLLGKGVLSYTQPQQGFPLFSDTIGPVEERTGAIPTNAERAAQTEALNTQAAAQAEQVRQERAAVQQVLAQTREQRLAAAAQQAAAARQAGTYTANPDFLQGGRGVEQGMRAEAAIARQQERVAVKSPKAPAKRTPPKAPAKVTPAETPVTAKGEATVTPAEKPTPTEQPTKKQVRQDTRTPLERAKAFIAARDASGNTDYTAEDRTRMDAIMKAFNLPIKTGQRNSTKERVIREYVDSLASDKEQALIEGAEEAQFNAMAEREAGAKKGKPKEIIKASPDDIRKASLADSVINSLPEFPQRAFKRIIGDAVSNLTEKGRHTFYAQFGGLLEKAYPNGVPQDIGTQRLRELLATLIKVRNEANKPETAPVQRLKRGASETEITEVTTSKDPYINALATTLDNPTYSNPLVSEETRQSLASIEKLLQQSDTDSSQLDIKHTANISDDELSARRAKAADTLDKLNEQFAALEASVKGGREAIQAAQAASKGRVAAAGESSQTSAASQFSRFYGGYINQSQGLTLDLATETAWREPNEKPLDKLPSDPAATELEQNGKLTTRTRLGKIALGRTVREDERNAVYKKTREDLEAINVGNNLPGNEDVMQQRVESHAAVDFLLREIIAKKAFNKLFPNLARTLQAALRRTGLLHAIEVQYFPHDHRQASAEYEFVKGINSPDRHIIKIYGEKFVNDKYFLHEVLHAATAAFVLNNPTAPEVAAFTAILDNAKVQAFLKKKTSKFSDPAKRFENMDVPHQILELIAYGFTDADFINLLRNTQIMRSDYNTPKGQKNFDTLAGFMKEAGNQLRNMYRAFVNTIRSIFKAQTGELNGFDAFLESYARMMTAIETGAETTEKQGGSAREMMSPSKGVSLQAISTTDGDLIEKAKYEEDARQDARAAEERRKVLADRESRANAIPPSQQRNLTAAESAIADDTVQNRRKIEQRSGYSIPDAPMKLLSAWIPKLWTKYAGEDSKYLREAIRDYAARNQRQGRFLSKIIDNFGLHPLFAAAWREAKNRVGFVDHLAYLVNSNNKLSWDEAIQKEFLSAVDSGKETGRYWLDRLVKEFRHAVDLAKEYNRLPTQLRNAPYSNIYIWNEGEQTKRFHGFKYSGLGNIFTRHNGHIYEGVDAFLGMPQADNTMPLSMWAKESIGPGGKPTYQFAFINQSIDDAAQEQAILRRYGPGFKKSSHTYYRVDDNRAYRPYTFAEKRAMDKKASAIRSAAAFIQDINHYVVGLQFGDEMIAENEPLDDDAKFLFELNDKNLQYLEDKVGKKRIIYFDQDKGPTHNKLMQTPGNWVVLRGTKWGKLDGEKTYIAPASVFSALYDYNTMEHMLLPQTLRKINRFWKRNMTVWSTTAHVNNMMSALITMYMHDIHVDDIKLAAKIIYKLVTKPESLTAQERAFYEEAERRGSLFGTFSVEEGVTGILEEQIKALEDIGEGDSTFAKLMSAAAAFAGPMTNGLKKARDGVIKADKFAGDLYANEDNVFRLAAYIGKVRELTMLNDGKPLSEAALQKAGSWAADVNVNYDINAKYIKYARESFWPFIAWPYRQVGNMAKLAVTKPWKFLNITAAFYLLDTLAYAMLGMSDDDRDWEKEVLPPYMKEGLWGLSFAPSYVRTPMGNGKESGVFWGGARAIPTADLTMVNDGMFVPQIAAPGGPMALAYQALINRDVFHDKPIMDDFVTPKENFESMMSFILRGSAPAVLTRVFDVGDKLGNDKRGPLGSEANAYIELARLMGLNVRDVNFAEAAYNKSIADKNSIQKIKANMRRAMNQELRYGTPDYDAMQQTLDEYNTLRLNWMEQ